MAKNWEKFDDWGAPFEDPFEDCKLVSADQQTELIKDNKVGAGPENTSGETPGQTK